MKKKTKTGPAKKSPAKRKKVAPVPEGFHTVTPYLSVKGVDRLLDFVREAFGARVVEKVKDGARISHAQVLIGDSMVMMGDVTGTPWPPTPAGLYLYVPDCDRLYKKALKAGATSVLPVQDMPYGDRSGGVKDPCGNTWWISTHVEDVTAPEIESRRKAARR
ncbi:MAG TPA: VOC family protein [Beijerinckiaceae bacterium]|nr:VOC family protein [Beijerinckiaceae bacterium]